MTPYPLIILGGEAGAGKDTAAAHLAERYGAAVLAQADPFKRIAKDIFGFDNNQLWGPSHYRNKVDTRFGDHKVLAAALEWVYGAAKSPVLDDVFPGATDTTRRRAASGLQDYFVDACHLRAGQDGGLSARFVLQYLGSEWGRRVDPLVWVRYSHAMAERLLAGGGTYLKDLGFVPVASFPGYPWVVVSDGRFRNEILAAKKVGGVALEVVRPGNEASAQAVAAAGIAGHVSEAQLKTVPPHFYDAQIFNTGTVADLHDMVGRAVDAMYCCGRFTP